MQIFQDVLYSLLGLLVFGIMFGERVGWLFAGLQGVRRTSRTQDAMDDWEVHTSRTSTTYMACKEHAGCVIKAVRELK